MNIRVAAALAFLLVSTEALSQRHLHHGAESYANSNLGYLNFDKKEENKPQAQAEAKDEERDKDEGDVIGNSKIWGWKYLNEGEKSKEEAKPFVLFDYKLQHDNSQKFGYEGQRGKQEKQDKRVNQDKKDKEEENKDKEDGDKKDEYVPVYIPKILIEDSKWYKWL